MDRKNVKAIYPLTGMQQGFLWHSIRHQQGAGLIHVRCRLAGRLDRQLFEAAWARVVDGHDALRTTVHWRQVKQPVQMVFKHVVAMVAWLDWRDDLDITERLESFLAADLQLGLDIEKAPVFRLTLIQVAEDIHELVWTCHHLLLDGWSGNLVLDQLLTHYDRATRRLPPLSDSSSELGSYFRWRKSLDTPSANAYWTKILSGFRAATPLPKRAMTVAADKRPAVKLGIALDTEQTRALQAFLRQSRLTLNAMMQGVWAIVLSRLSAHDDVVFGVTVSGRSGELAGADKLVGMLINVMPIRVRLHAQDSLQEVLTAINAQSFASQRYSHVDGAQILDWSDCRGALYTTLLVVENQPGGTPNESLEISQRQSGIASAYGLTLTVKPADGLVIELMASDDTIDVALAQPMLDAFVDLIARCISSPALSVADAISASAEGLTHGAAVQQTASVPMGNPSDAPGSWLEGRLQRIWSQVLALPSVGRHDSFFDLGGTSLLAARMFQRIEQTFGRALPPTTLFQAGTVAALAALLAEDDSLGGDPAIVEIQAGGSKLPLFIPDTATDLLIYRHLARHLGPTQPIYAFRARDRRQERFSDVARQFVSHVRQIQPHGPYAIAGMSGGGSLAWLMAQQLREQGAEVALLVLFDCLGPDYPTLLPPLARVRSCLRAGWRQLRRQRSAGLATLDDGNNDEPRAQVSNANVVAAEVTAAAVPPGRAERALSIVHALTTGLPIGQRIANLTAAALIKLTMHAEPVAWVSFMQGVLRQPRVGDKPADPMLHGYALQAAKISFDRLYAELKAYDGEVLYFRAHERPPGVADDPGAGWQRLITGPLTAHEIPGSHVSLLQDPNVGQLAARLAAELARVHTSRETI